ncbi:hypothetical protein [Arsukibacterium indicum]|uniref:Uncharacterized protein n=1 Tax=Arsukibacterium indicum TaxID=2848612 RepID=A0ABS6MHJ8_9GAMM|nr:hypothetical protein [Arsukibacterium indicum]MBV2128274.1 hypothetical protein [Arsukibacterium indicum]
MKRNRLMSTVGFLVLTYAGSVSALTPIKGYTCENCSLQQAENIARSRGAPLLNCVPINNNEVISIDEHACYSTPHKFIIFDVATKTTYPFQMSHSNQGGSNWDMILNSNPTNLTSVESEISQDFFDFLEMQEQTLQAIALSEEENLQLSFASPSSMSASSYSSTSDDGCESDTSATVLRMALSPTYRNNLRNSVNHELSQRNPSSYKSEFEEIQFTQFGFEAQKAGVGLSVGWEYLKKSKLVIKNVFEPGQQVVPDGEPYFPARAAFKLSWNNTLDSISVEVEREFTRVTEDLTLADVLEDSSWNMTLSACAIVELQNHYTASNAVGSGGGGGTPGGGSPGGGDPGGIINFPAPNPASQEQCKWHFYGKEGQLLVTLMGPCP